MALDPVAGSAGLRIGDAERERAAQALGEHLRAGRLEMAEYDERLERAYAARTASDLVPLFADLPGGSPLGPHSLGPNNLVQPPPHARPSRRVNRPAYSALALPIRVVAVLALIGAAIVCAVFLTFPPLFLLPLLWFTFGRRFAHHGYNHHGYNQRGYRHGHGYSANRYRGSSY